MAKESIKVGIVGGTGYTGVELLRLLAQHPRCELAVITSRKEAGMPVADMFPNLRGRVTLKFTEPSRDALTACDVVFFATPNGVAMNEARALLRRRRAHHRHRRRLPPEGRRGVGAVVQDEARLPRARRGGGLRPAGNQSRARSARRASSPIPGCYPTAVQLGFLPLVESGAVDLEHLIADAKSGVSGAGRKAEVHTLFAEATDNFKAYGVPGHRHLPEITQGLTAMARTPVKLVFTPHLTPMIRGIHATLYARLTQERRPAGAVREALRERAVRRRDAGRQPSRRRARCAARTSAASPCTGRRSGDIAVVLSVIDNLVKGAAGQAVQNMNIMFGLPETLGA